MNYINRLFDIRADEWQRLLLLYGLAFLLNISVVWGQAASDALFLKQLGVDYLPLMFIADALLTISAMTIYGAFVDRISNMWLMVGISLLGGLLLLLVRFGLQFEVTIVYYLLYLLERVLKALISIHAWTYIADFYNTRDAKRHFPLIASASRPSGIIAGLVLIPLVQYCGTEDLLIAWIIILLLSAWLTWYTSRQVNLVVEVKEEQNTSVVVAYREGFDYVLSSPFLRQMALAAIVGTIILYLLDYHSQRIFVEQFESSEQLASFYGLLGAFSDLLILPIQMVILSRLVTRLGVGKANLIFPSLTTLSYALMSLLPNLTTASFARMDRLALRSAFRTPIDSLLYNALPVQVKGRSRAFINGLLIPVGTVLAGLILLMVNEQTFWPITLFGLIISAIYMIVSLRIRYEYTNSLMTLLSEELPPIPTWSDQGFEGADPAIIKRLNERLEASTDDDLTIFLAEILIDLQGSAALEKLEMLAIHRSPKVQVALLDKMATFWDEQVRHFSLAALKHHHPDVRYAAIKALTHAPNMGQDKSLQEIFRARINDPDERVQAAVIVPLLASGDFYYSAPAVERLSRWLDPRSEVHYRKIGLQLLAEHCNDHLLPSLVGYLSDPDAQIRRQTVKLIHQIANRTELKKVRRSGLEKLRGALSDEDESVRLAVVKALKDFTGPEVNQALLIALKDPSFIVRSEACQAMPILPELEEMLESENRYLAESAAYILAGHLKTRPRILELIEELVRDAYILQGQRLLIESLQLPAVKLLDQTLLEEVEQLMQRAFWLLAGLSNKEKADTIQRALRSEKPLTRANGAETLESLASPRLSHLIVPLFDGVSRRLRHQRPLAEVVQIGQKLLGLPRQNMQQFLCQCWKELCGGKQETLSFNLRPLYKDGWLTATVIYMLWQMRQSVLNEGTPKLLLLNNKVLLYALKATLAHSAPPLVQETATLVWYALGDSILESSLQESKMWTKIEKIIFMKQVSFFNQMQLKHLRILADISEEVSYESGQQIVTEGQEADALYVVVSGRVAMQREVMRQGVPAILRLTTLRPYDYFAEMSIFDDKAHDADAIALENTTLLLIRQRPLMALIDHQPELSVSLLKVLSQRLRRANDLIASKSPSKPKVMVDLYDKGLIHRLGAFENRILLQP